MEAKEQNDKGISINLTRAEALVFFDWLGKFTSDQNAVCYSHKAEEQLLFNFEACLEKILVEPFEENYQELVRLAQDLVSPNG